MAKSNYLPGILFIGAVFICCGAGGLSIAEWNLESGAWYQDGSSSRLRLKQIYDSQIGVRESGLNRGPEVEKYLAYVNLPKGNPWCAAFVCWVFGKAGIANPRTGWSPSLFPASKVIWKAGSGVARQITPNTKQIIPTTGDVFGIYFPEKNRIAHAGFIDSWDGTWLITVEGNTNTSGNPEGDGVYRKRRAVRSIYRVARYIN